MFCSSKYPSIQSLHTIDNLDQNIYPIVSGEAPEHPVVSKKTGHVYERRLIEKYISEHSTCPVSGLEMVMDDLVELQVPKIVRPRPPVATSIPSLLSMFQSEWDSLMLQTFSLKKELDHCRSELSNALYEHEAACRLISKLVKERDARRSGATAAELESAPKRLKKDIKMSNDVQVNEEVPVSEDSKIDESVVEKMKQVGEGLAKNRKKRVIPDSHATLETVKQYAAVSGHNYAAKKDINCLDIHPSTEMMLLGNDSSVYWYNLSHRSKSPLGHIDAHEAAINQVILHIEDEGIGYSCSKDKSICVLSLVRGKSKVVHRFDHHSDEVTGISLHPSGEYLVSCSKDATWSLMDLTSNSVLSVNRHPDDSEYSCIQFHPDGLILGTACGSTVRIWNATSQSHLVSFNGHTGRVTCMSFSENGKYLVTGSDSGEVKFWDLRKIANFHTIKLDSPVNAVQFDYSGRLIAIGSDDLRVYSVNEWQLGYSSTEFGSILDLRFTGDAHQLAIVTAEKDIKFIAAA